MAGFGDWLTGRKRLLRSAEPERAFAPDPNLDIWQLDPTRTNDEAYDFIRKNGLSLIRVASGETAELTGFADGVLLLATNWEPYSAKTIGALKQKIDAGRIGKFSIVFFENSRDQIIATKKQSWYFQDAWVLAPASVELKKLIASIPFFIYLTAEGSVAKISEGKA